MLQLCVCCCELPGLAVKLLLSSPLFSLKFLSDGLHPLRLHCELTSLLLLLLLLLLH